MEAGLELASLESGAELNRERYQLGYRPDINFYLLLKGWLKFTAYLPQSLPHIYRKAYRIFTAEMTQDPDWKMNTENT